MGLDGWLPAEGSDVPSRVHFFFRKPRVGIKQDGRRRPRCSRLSALGSGAAG